MSEADLSLIITQKKGGWLHKSVHEVTGITESLCFGLKEAFRGGIVDILERSKRRHVLCFCFIQVDGCVRGRGLTSEILINSCQGTDTSIKHTQMIVHRQQSPAGTEKAPKVFSKCSHYTSRNYCLSDVSIDLEAGVRSVTADG